MKATLTFLTICTFLLIANSVYSQVSIGSITPTCAPACNGKVKLLIATPNWDLPLSIVISGDNGYLRQIDNVRTSQIDMDNLCVGHYNLSFYPKGFAVCTTSIPFVILDERVDFNVNLQVEHVPVDQKLGGSIRAVPSPSGQYKYSWNTGKEETSGIGSTISNLVAGQYNVSVTLAEGCSETKVVTAEVEDCNLSFPLGVALRNLKQPSLNTSDGEINLAVENACKQYQIQWVNNQTQQTIPNDSHQGGCVVGSKITGLESGTYTFILTDIANGCQLSRSYELKACGSAEGFPESTIKDFEVKIERTIDEINNRITARVLIRYKDDALGFIPLPPFFTIRWYGEGVDYLDIYERELSGTIDQFPGLVYAVVSNGCYTHEAELRNSTGQPEIQLDIKQACVSPEGVEYKEGEVFITVKYPYETPNMQLKLLGDKVPNGEISLSFTKNTGNKEITAKLKLRMGNYRVEFISDRGSAFDLFTVGSTRTSGGDFAYEKDLVCYYDNPHCGTTDDILTRLPARVIPIDDVNSTAEMCAANIKCGETIVKTTTSPTEELINQEYWNLLWSLKNSPNYDWEYVLKRIDEARGKKECTKLTFCPITLKAVYHNSPERSAADITESDGCRTYKCRKGFAGWGRETLTFCDSDWGKNVLNALGGIDFRCQKVTYYLSDMIRWYKEGVFASNQIFLNSPVATFIAENISRESELCSTISFCKNKFTNMSVDLVDCGTGFAYVYGDPVSYIDDEGAVVVTGQRIPVSNCHPNWQNTGRYCIKNGRALFVPYQNTYRPNLIPDIEPSLTVENEVISSLNEVEPIDTTLSALKAIKTNYPNESLFNFAKLTADSIPVPKGIVSTDQGMYFYEYGDGHLEVNKERIGKVKFYASNWDNDYLSTVEEIESRKSYVISTQRDTLRWTNDLKSDQYLDVDYFSQDDTTLTISGRFSGQLSMNSLPLKQIFSSTGVFILRTSTHGELQSTKFIVGTDSTIVSKYTETQEGHLVFAVKAQSNLLEVDNVNLNLSSNGQTVLFHHTPSHELQVMHKYVLPNSAKIASLGLNQSATECAVLINGIDSLNQFENEAIGQPGNKLILQVLNQNGIFKRSSHWSFQTESQEKHVIIYGQDNDLFLGITFRDTLRLNQTIIKSRGGADIAIIKLASTGEQSWFKHYGTVDHEEVSQLMYSTGFLYFGGIFDGSTRVRTIGNYDFVNAASFTKNVYISYVADSSAQVQPPVTTPELLTISPKKPSTRKGEIQVKIYPNPFQNEFSLQINSDRSFPLTATLFNEIGRNVMSFNWNAVIGENLYTIPTSQLSSGFYFLQLRDNQGKLVQTHKIIKL